MKTNTIPTSEQIAEAFIKKEMVFLLKLFKKTAISK